MIKGRHGLAEHMGQLLPPLNQQGDIAVEIHTEIEIDQKGGGGEHQHDDVLAPAQKPSHLSQQIPHGPGQLFV